LPSITVTALINDAVYWEPAPNTGGFPDGGVFADPVDTKCRWIDAPFNRQEANRSYLYIDRDVRSGGYLFKGTLDDLLPGAMTEYPNESNQLGEWVAHWQFDGNLHSQDEGPSFVITQGAAIFEEGARDCALTNDGGSEFRNEISTDGVVDLQDEKAYTLSFFLRLQAPPSPSPSPSPASPSVSPSLASFGALGASASVLLSPSPEPSFVTMNFGPLVLQIEGGALYVNGNAIDANLYDYEWVNLQVVNDEDEITVLVRGDEVATLAPVPVDSFTAQVQWFNDSGEIFWLDEMLIYPFAATAAQSKSLAGLSPLDYDNAKSIIRTQFASSINGKLRVRKVMLEGRIE